MTAEKIQVIQVNEGRAVEFRGKLRNRARTIKVGRIWHVYYDGEVIGAIRYALMTREQRTPGRTYVNSRWQSPGWQAIYGEKAKNATTEYATGFHRAREHYSKKDAIESIVRDHERNNNLGYWSKKEN